MNEVNKKQPYVFAPSNAWWCACDKPKLQKSKQVRLGNAAYPVCACNRVVLNQRKRITVKQEVTAKTA